jgi:hypothetical protein
MFESAAWPQVSQSRAASGSPSTAAAIDVAARMRGMWR